MRSIPVTRLTIVALLVTLGTGCEPDAEPYAGNELFAANCSACHGIYGDGTGPAAASIDQSIPDLRLISMRNGGEFPRETIERIVDGREISEGHASDTMPKWGHEFELGEGYSDAAQRRVRGKIDALVGFLEGNQIVE